MLRIVSRWQEAAPGRALADGSKANRKVRAKAGRDANGGNAMGESRDRAIVTNRSLTNNG
jgi:hypothetical protein